MAGYGDNQGFRDYAAAAGYVIPDETSDADIAAARQRGSIVIDRYEMRFSGSRSGGYMQDRAWPRSGACTYYGEPIPGDVIPAPIVNASYEAAFLELTNPGSLLPVITLSEDVKRERIGHLEVEYQDSPTGATRDELIALATPVVSIIEGLLFLFLRPVLPGILAV
ncbi:DnaT-like ssDNA-binding protein [Rhizobium sp. WW_1]|jgi:hypothetical protein|uniref:DnaT-like ssDNA-binding protein n=1 Tax=Rhizobium sp. WW_1 TaxID=1907375 RepID=UPI0006472C3C|nr:DnaT-like ssDNA-binding protein [Rhizobium sp. WW_1]RKD68977.1 hypothetical protein BJ928_104115 [Rhizobium sp. WW_1]